MWESETTGFQSSFNPVNSGPLICESSIFLTGTLWQRKYWGGFVPVTDTKTECFYPCSTGPWGAHVGDKCNLAFLRVWQWSWSCEKIGQPGWCAQAQSIKASRGVSLLLVRAERHTGEAWPRVTERHSEREVKCGRCQFHSKEDSGCIIQIFCHLFSSVILGEGKSRSEKFTLDM